MLPVALIVLALGASVAWYGRVSGFVLPLVGHVNPFEVLVTIKPGVDSAGFILGRNIFIENFVLWFTIYFIAYLIMYVEPQRRWLHPFKFNPAYPPSAFMFKEFIRSCSGVIICSIYEAALSQMYVSGALPVTSRLGWCSPISPLAAPTSALSVPISILLAAPLAMYLWGDAHFYWFHRLIHHPKLYTWIHKMHHESFNPTPWSGLSMHPIEHIVYFSAFVMLSPVLPYWLFRAAHKAMLVLPLEGHCGYGADRKLEAHHYIHHTKFNWNYGSSRLWDVLLGTDYKPKGALDPVQAKEAIAQAKQCGIDLKVRSAAASRGNATKAHNRSSSTSRK